MKRIYYPITVSKVAVAVMTLVVLIAAVINGNEIVAVFLALAALILAMCQGQFKNVGFRQKEM
ncbi:hypothetical protein LFAB_08365 [Lactiplantibacillus fabifermentans T30PCM01]|uniref:Uncharacterized protein n=1 Tax=Lactiplantibacillus fabifermentans T30PCM01 TaxID=1400520 RepID=W6T7P9_9LACO|nr:hypothetical protein [Lactiplantibacillus fabifermentans]ETY74189.1 hypothetical protein LFAB_08365 [Lactiplantibacillus fabifermentans T30PCM01]